MSVIVPGRPRRVPVRHRVPAAVALAVALVAGRLPLRHRIRLVRCVRALPYAAPARLEQLHAAVLAVRPTWWPGRIACLETSLAMVIAAALTGRRARWVLGARFLPHAAHAWAEVPGAAVGRDEQGAADRPWLPVLTV
ncbi:hypothetical protein GCM10027160_28700 [Streptomyces calidiresistens]|uniref:Lasso peptide biosynthesis B2 protein n=1 Tax=Streptomyces calidiresistens TaxID=1485586 RepID=A0A7W3XVY3_9ACTN|nr:lasso peptide biosynthesis B2 protein [Streptomyces calidiresistens]MBB0229299.1 lasso peptide biosynthesis B2 protein [Streptomyces calidiresistens]